MAPGLLFPLPLPLPLLLLAWSTLGVGARKSEPRLSEAGAGFLRGSDQHRFSVQVKAATTECFWHFAHQSGSFFLSYMVRGASGLAGDLRLFVTLGSPGGALLSSHHDTRAQMTFQTQETGFYRICLGNHDNSFGHLTVFVDFGVVYEGTKETTRDTDDQQEALNGTLAGIQESVQRLQVLVFHMWRHYNFARMRKGKDHYALLSNLWYVDRWSAAQSLAIGVCGLLQLFVLKRMFRREGTGQRC